MGKSIAKTKKSFKLPHVYITLMIIMLVVVALSWVIPSGQFVQIEDPNTGRLVIDPTQFNYVANDNPIGFLDYFQSIHDGIVQSGDIIINLIIASAVLYMIEQSGAIAAGVHKILEASEGKETFIVAILTLVFAILGAIGFGEGGIPFIPLAMSVVMALGFDRIAGVATAMVGLCVGFASGVLNLFTTGISQNIVGLPMFSGMAFRLFGLVIFYIIGVAYIILYCRKIKKDPSKSIVAQEYINQDLKSTKQESVPMTMPRALSLIGLLSLFILMAYGSSRLGWGLPQISALYLVLAVFLVIIFKQSPSEACVTFSVGASRLLPAALTIGIARSTMILMNQSKIVDTAIYKLAGFLDGKGSITVLILVYLAVIIFNFFVVSGSGKAVIMMPILGPLGQLLHINQQVMVLVYQYGDGFTNYFWPTSGGLLAGLSMCDVEWQDWAKFSWKLFVILSTVAFGLVLVANAIKLGPF